LTNSNSTADTAALAGEMSGHIFFAHRWYGFDDALYAAVRLIEAVGQFPEDQVRLVSVNQKENGETIEP
jgi:phosphomannomutase